jgi:hypothetical protein
MDASGKVFGVILIQESFVFRLASRRNAEFLAQMTNVKAQSSNEIQISNDQNGFWHPGVCHLELFL